MGESHTRGTLSWRPVTPEDTTGQSAMARFSYGRPFKPYVYRGGEPAAVTAARERHRALNAALEAEEIDPAAVPGYEWCRELRDEDAAPRVMAPGPAPEPDPPPAPPSVTAPARCRRCKYLTTSAGHRVMCGE
jgi:hypothetical protein